MLLGVIIDEHNNCFTEDTTITSLINIVDFGKDAFTEHIEGSFLGIPNPGIRVTALELAVEEFENIMDKSRRELKAANLKIAELELELVLKKYQCN